MTGSIVAQRPFYSVDDFSHVMSFANASDFFNAALVCKEWKQFTDVLADNYSLWKVYSENKGIPMVCTEGGKRDCRADYCAIYPMTSVSGEMFRKIFGEPEGEVPCISTEIFNRFSQPDPFDGTKLQKDTWHLVVEYPFIHRVLNDSIPLALDAKGNLMEAPRVPAAPPVTRIPFTLQNRVKLLYFPLEKSEHQPLIEGIYHEEIISQNDYCPLRVNVWYERRKGVEGTRNCTHSEQEVFVKPQGLKIMPFGHRLLSDAVEIYELGTCPDDMHAFACTSTRYLLDGHERQVVVDRVKPGVGLRASSFDDVTDFACAAVGIPAEANL